MKKHLKYLKYLLVHKWYVMIECWKYGLIWRGIKHDWSKFLPSEWFPYVEYFYGEKEDTGRLVTKNGVLVPEFLPPVGAKVAFNEAWNHHQKRNRHHWQYWLLTQDQPNPQMIPTSHDGGMTHLYITASYSGQVAAVIYDERIKDVTDFGAREELLKQLRQVPVALPMPDADRKEMLADWIGAGKAQGNPYVWEWYEKNRDNINLHFDTFWWVRTELSKKKSGWERELEAIKRTMG